MTCAASPLLLMAACLLASAAAAVDFERIALETPITEGLGLENILTINDETPRMFRSLGQPTRSGGGKYVYEGKKASIVVEANYENGRFPIRSITVLGRDARIKTLAGAAAGDEPSRIVALYGEPAAQSETRLDYPALGLELLLGKGTASEDTPAAAGAPLRVVTGFVVKRATLGVPGELPTPLPEAPVAAPESTGVAFQPAGVALALGARWRVDAAVTRAGGTARSDGGEIRVERCEACAGRRGCVGPTTPYTTCEEQVEARVRTIEEALGPNRLPEARRTLDAELLATIGAESGYAAVHGPLGGNTPTWVLALRRGAAGRIPSGTDTWLIVLTLTGSEPLPEITADVLGALRSLTLVRPD